MQCNPSTYTGFSGSGSGSKHKTFPRPGADIPVRRLRRSYADFYSDSGAPASETPEEESVPCFDPYARAVAWVLIGFMLPFGSTWFQGWAAVTVLLFLCTSIEYWKPAIVLAIAYKLFTLYFL